MTLTTASTASATGPSGPNRYERGLEKLREIDGHAGFPVALNGLFAAKEVFAERVTPA